jgi:hypothetical protein
VRAAVEDGRLDAARVDGLRKLEAEARAAAGRRGGPAGEAAKRRAKALSRAIRRYHADEDGRGDD